MPSLSVKFYLESRVKGNDQKLLPVFLYVRHRGRTIKLYTERKCTRAGWDIKKCRANPRRFRSATELNGFLSDLEEESSNLFHYNTRHNVLTSKEHLLKVLNNLTGGNHIDDQDIIDFAEQFVAKAKIATSTAKAYKTTIRTLDEYSASKRKRLLFNDIDLNFYDDFTSWLWKNKHLNDNSVGKHIKIIKAIMSQAFERDLHSNLHFKKKQFKVFKRDADTIYLNESELGKLQKVDLSSDIKLSKVRDAFLIASWTGLRFSDLARVTKEKFIIEDKILIFKIESEKTGEVVKIPISPMVRPILEKYNFNIPVFSNQKMNEYLKTIGEKAELDTEVELSDVKAGKKSREKFFKHQLITTHTARRSFASNLFLQGLPSRSIMAVTGHRTEKAFLAYIKLSKLEQIREIDSHFKKRHKSKRSK
jgi:integrase